MARHYQVTFPTSPPDAETTLAKIFGACVAVGPSSYIVYMIDESWDALEKTLRSSWPGTLPDFVFSIFYGDNCTDKKLLKKIKALEGESEKGLLERVGQLTQEVQGLRKQLDEYEKKPGESQATPEGKRSFDAAALSAVYKDLDALMGMEDAKKLIQELDAKRKMNLLMAAAGMETDETSSNHLLATGAPGTGKTTFARLYARALKALGILSKGHLIETDRAGLVGGYIGHTEEKTDAVLDKAEGGILFIDEAYSLYSSYENDFGRVALAQILKRMEDRRGDLVIVMAGYPDEMEKLLTMNSGLKSRFGHTLFFPDFSDEDLLKIARAELARRVLTPCQEFTASFHEMVRDARQDMGKSFGNGRFVRTLIGNAELAMVARLDREGKLDQAVTAAKNLSADDIKTMRSITRDDIAFMAPALARRKKSDPSGLK